MKSILLLSAAAAMMVAAAPSAFAQTDNDAVMKRLDQMQKMIEAQQKQIETQKKEIGNLNKALGRKGVATPAPEPVAAPAPVAPAAPPPVVETRLQQQDQIQRQEPISSCHFFLAERGGCQIAGDPHNSSMVRELLVDTKGLRAQLVRGLKLAGRYVESAKIIECHRIVLKIVRHVFQNAKRFFISALGVSKFSQVFVGESQDVPRLTRAKSIQGASIQELLNLDRRLCRFAIYLQGKRIVKPLRRCFLRQQRARDE